HLEVDVATYEQSAAPGESLPNGSRAATIAAPVWAPPIAPYTMSAVFPESFEVRIFANTGGLTLVAAIELISPGNKDRPEERRAFATKCASYLHQGISLILIDIVTSRRANLHNETMRLMAAAPEFELAAEVDLYSVAYRPVRREDRPEIDWWWSACHIGQPLPVMPLRLTG